MNSKQQQIDDLKRSIAYYEQQYQQGIQEIKDGVKDIAKDTAVYASPAAASFVAKKAGYNKAANFFGKFIDTTIGGKPIGEMAKKGTAQIAKKVLPKTATKVVAGTAGAVAGIGTAPITAALITADVAPKLAQKGYLDKAINALPFSIVNKTVKSFLGIKTSDTPIQDWVKPGGKLEKAAGKVYDFLHKGKFEKEQEAQAKIDAINQKKAESAKRLKTGLAVGGGLAALSLGGALAYKLYTSNKNKKRSAMNKSFEESTLSLKLSNFASKGTIKGGVKTAQGFRKVAKNFFASKQGKDVAKIAALTTGGIILAPHAGTAANKMLANAIGGNDAKESINKNIIEPTKEQTEKVVNKISDVTSAAIGSGALVAGAATGGVPGAILAPVGYFAGKALGGGISGQIAGAGVGLIGGALINSYMKKIQERKKLQDQLNPPNEQPIAINQGI